MVCEVRIVFVLCFFEITGSFYDTDGRLTSHKKEEVAWTRK